MGLNSGDAFLDHAGMEQQELIPRGAKSSDTAETLSPGRALRVELLIDDPEVVAELRKFKSRRDRERYAAEALRMGVLALRMAGGHVDTAAIKQAGAALISDLNEQITSKTDLLKSDLAHALSEYFDPKTGSVPARLESMLKADGELERVLRSHIGDNSTLSETLGEHVGEGSELFKLLSPTDADGLRSQIEATVDTALTEQRDKVVREFSLDHPDSALSRLVGQISEQQGDLQEGLSEQIESMVREFSLDEPDSALNRMVTQLSSQLNELTEKQGKFYAEMKSTLEAQKARREEEHRSTRHGDTFEQELNALLQRSAQRQGDVFEATGGKAGRIRSNKKGDAVIHGDPESPLAGERIVWEAKESQKWDLAQALDFIQEARKNRAAQVGVFVFSAKTAPEGLEPFKRYLNDIVIVWDAEDPATDVYIHAAYSLSRSLLMNSRNSSDGTEKALTDIDKATRSVERQIQYLDEFRRTGEGIVRGAEKIVDRAQRMEKQLLKDVAQLEEQLQSLRALEE